MILKYSRLQKISEGGELRPPIEVGTGSPDEPVTLSTIIDRLNERFGTQFKPEDALFFEQAKASAIADEAILERDAAAGSPA